MRDVRPGLTLNFEAFIPLQKHIKATGSGPQAPDPFLCIPLARSDRLLQKAFKGTIIFFG